MADRQEHQPPPPRQQQRVRRRTSSLSQHPPNGADWELNRHPSTLSPSGVDLGLPTQQPVGSGGGGGGGSTKWVAHPKHRSSPLRSNLRRSVGWPLANLLARDGFLAAALVSNPRGDALPQFWMLQRGVVVFLAISFNACLSQALRYEPSADELYSVGLWRISTALFVMGSMAALCSVGYFAWVGIVFASVPKVQFPSFVAQNGPAFSAATYTHFIAFVTALLGTETRVWAEHPFWVAGAPWSSRLIGFAGLAGLIIFLYGALTLINVFSATICNDNGFDGHIWPGLAESTNVTLQRHQALVEKEQEKQTQQQLQQQQEIEKAQDEHRNGDKVNSSQRSSVSSSPQADLLALINGMRADEVAAWLQTDKRLAVLGDVARKECIEGSALLEMVHMTAAEASAYYVTLFPSCPRGLGIVLWRMIRSSSSSSSTPRQGGLAPRRSTIGRSTSQLDSTSRAALGMGK